MRMHLLLLLFLSDALHFLLIGFHFSSMNNRTPFYSSSLFCRFGATVIFGFEWTRWSHWTMKYITYLQYCKNQKYNTCRTTEWLPRSVRQSSEENWLMISGLWRVCVLPPAPLSSVTRALHHQTHYKVQNSVLNKIMNFWKITLERLARKPPKQILIRDLMLWEIKIKMW